MYLECCGSEALLELSEDQSAMPVFVLDIRLLPVDFAIQFIIIANIA